MNKKIIGVVGLAFLLIVSAGSAKAADFVGPGYYGDSSEKGQIIIDRNETHSNLYVAGADVTVNGATTGDLYAAGSNVTVDGPVSEDVVAAGGTVTITAPVGGDVRIASGKVTINAPVSGDVVIFGGTVLLTDKATVGGDVYAAGGTLTVGGPVSGNVDVSGGDITIDSKIEGLVRIKSTGKTVFSDKADIALGTDVSSRHEPIVENGANVKINFTALKDNEHKSAKASIFGWLVGSFILHFLALGIATLLFTYVFRKMAIPMTEAMRRRPWAHLGIGFLAAIVIPIACLILLGTVVGFYIAAIAFTVYILLLLLSCLVSTVFIGAWIIKLLTKKDTLVLDWQAVVLGTAIMILLPLIPVVGFLIDIILGLIAFGAIVTVGWRAARPTHTNN